jgi:hypothetical protein
MSRRKGFLAYDGTENERPASGGTLQDIVHDFFGLCHRRDKRKFLLIEIDFGKLADKGLAEVIGHNAGPVRNVVYVFGFPHGFSLKFFPKKTTTSSKDGARHNWRTQKFSGLAWALIFGLFVSTTFTLIIVPVMYYLIFKKYNLGI